MVVSGCGVLMDCMVSSARRERGVGPAATVALLSLAIALQPAKRLQKGRLLRLRLWASRAPVLASWNNTSITVCFKMVWAHYQVETDIRPEAVEVMNYPGPGRSFARWARLQGIPSELSSGSRIWKFKPIFLKIFRKKNLFLGCKRKSYHKSILHGKQSRFRSISANR